MNSKHLVDPELLSAIDALPVSDLSSETLPNVRAWFEEAGPTMRASLPELPDLEKREYFVPGPAGVPDVRVLVFKSKIPGKNLPGYFNIHGGGYVMGNADMAELTAGSLAVQLGCVVAAVDYRLAPETTAPGNVEDCYAALKWFHANATELGVNPNQIAIGGESAGGGLAAALALLVRDRGEIPIIHQQLVFPMLDDRSPAEPHPYTGEFGWTPGSNRFGWKSLLGREPGGDGISPYAAPARATNLEGLPPTFIGVGALDLFLEENLEYARRLTRAGVPVELHVYPGAFHGSDMVTTARVSKMHARDQLEALRAAFERTR